MDGMSTAAGQRSLTLNRRFRCDQGRMPLGMAGYRLALVELRALETGLGK